MVPTDITEMRGRLGLTQGELAALLGVHPLTVSKWERGLLRPTSHQEVLMESFDKARRSNKKIGDEAKQALVAAGVIVALTILLVAALEGEAK